MHPKEYKKTKNGTGKITYKTLKNSELYVGIDFSNHEKINKLIKNYNCYILYPSINSICLNNQTLESKRNNLIFIIDSTWPCSKAILKQSKNLQTLPSLSFNTNKTSNFKFKTQPKEYCLSTIESTKIVLELLNNQKFENISKKNLDSFLLPFEKLVQYQISCSKNSCERFKTS